MSHHIFNRIIKVTFLTFISIGVLAGCTRKNDGANETINAYVSSNVKGLDTALAGDLYINTVAQLMNDTLLTYTYEDRPVKLVPLMADGMPTVSKDGLVHTFKIKAGSHFQDDAAFAGGKGRAVTAKDFIFAWKRIADPKVNSDGFWIFDGRIVGLNEWRENMIKGTASYETEVAGLKAIDDSTLQITLTKPFYQLHYVLTMNYTAPVAHEAVEKYGQEYLNHPVGTGPFQLKNWVRGSKIELVRNTNYKTDLKLANKIVFNEIIEDQARWLKFMKGELDFVEIPKDNFDNSIKDGKVVAELEKKGISLTIENEVDVTYYAFNMLDPLLGKNKDLRLAIAHAIDFDALIKNFYNNRAITANTLIPPGLDGFDANFKNPNKGLNISKTKEYLQKAGFPDGKGLPEIEFSTSSSGTQRQMAEFVQQSLAKVGIKLKIVTSTWPQFRQKIDEKKAQMWGIAWGADYPDAENFLQLLYGPNEAPGANGSNFKDAKYDELYKKAALLPPGEERTKLYKEMRDIFVQEVPWVPGVHRTVYTLQHSWVKNLKRHPIQAYNLRFVQVDSKERAVGIKGL